MKRFKINSISAFALLAGLTAMSLSAQGQSYIDEDFLDNIEANARFMLTEGDPAFRETNIPARWNKESAVIIGYSRNVLFDKKSRGGFIARKERSLWFLEKSHFKIKLNDNSSAQAFSEIYFRYGAKEDGFIARIIKPDGTITNIDLKNAVGVESLSNVPEYFRSFFDKVAYSQYNYYKTPVPDLEPGDILEYVTNTKSRLDVTSSGYIEFAPVYEVCSKNYPVMHNEIVIETDDKSFFKYLSLNGAPKFAKENAAENNFFRYVFVDKNRETEKDINFVSPFLQYPLVKFQVIYSNNDQAKGALIGEKGELKSEFTKEELARKAWEDYEMVGDTYIAEGMTVQNFISQCWSELQRLGAKRWSEDQYAENAYYLLRNKVIFRDTYLSDKVFAYAFGSLLFQRNIKSDIIISMSNSVGKLNEVLFDEEIRYVIRLGDKLYFNLTDFSNPEDLSESLLDNEAYIIYPPAKKGGKQEIKPFRLPGTTTADNTTDVVIRTQLSADMKNLMVIRTTSYKGIPKAKESPDALKYIPYMFDDYSNYGGNSPTEYMKTMEIENFNSSVRALKDEFKKQKPEFVKASLESEFHQPVRNVHFDLVSDGRSQRKKILVTKEGFELTTFVRKAGKKYMVNLAGLIGSQLQIRREERDRKYDIDVRYPRSYTWSISFKIPDGYTVQGLTEISKSVDNETGSFSLTTKEESGSLIINVSKVYKQKSIPKDKWERMLDFIDAAYNSSFKYILLIPKQ